MNKEAIKNGLGGGLHGTASRVLQGIKRVDGKRKRGAITFLNEADANLAENEQPIGSRYVSNYKAELVRHNIVTRTDLIKLY